MKIYFAGGLSMVDAMRELSVENVLSSWIEKKTKFYPEFNVFLDSAAFTAWTQGKTINLNEYIEFIKKHEHDLGGPYAVLDVIGSDKGTFENYKKMKQSGLNPLAVFHRNGDFAYLRKYLEREKYIAIGGMVGCPKNKARPFLDNCFSIIKDYWPVKVHGFGITSLWALKRYPFYSVDSTSWLSGGRFGRLMEFENMSLKSSHYRDKDVIDKRPEKYHNFVVDGETKSYKERDKHNIKVFLKLEKTITAIWAERGITWN